MLLYKDLPSRLKATRIAVKYRNTELKQPSVYRFDGYWCRITEAAVVCYTSYGKDFTLERGEGSTVYVLKTGYVYVHDERTHYYKLPEFERVAPI